MNKLLLLKQYFLTKYGRRFTSREKLLAFHDKKMKKHIKNVLKHSTFYKKLYQDERYHHDWTSLPIITKSDMMDSFNELNTVGIKKEKAFQLAFDAEETRDFSPRIGNVSIGLSSGTSGNRGLFLVSNREEAMWAGTVLAKMLPSSIFREHRVAFFLRANSNLYESTESGKISFHYFDLLDSFPKHIERLNQLKPSIIIAPPSMLRMIATWKHKQIISISPEKIISVAEVLEDLDRTYIEHIFQQTLHQVYQATEGFLAATCSFGVLHMNEDIIAVQKEYLNKEKGIFVPIISDFTRKTQPIIRYRLNDILIEKKTACPCGSHFLALERIDGRCDDLFYGKKLLTNEEICLFPDFIRKSIMIASDQILEYKVMQREFNLIEIKLKVESDEEVVKELVLAELQKLWKHEQLLIPQFHFTPYDIVTSDRKLKRIENMMKGKSNDSFI
ncbi:F390 synthetase-related protein [Metabacillus sp. YM-086]|uniref:F390 synthetase-related protein n=1 Tax=Metabacillus sp. YM-086 TaxID=3341729 RepID=UPI001B9409FB